MIVTEDERSAGSATACRSCRIFVVVNVARRDLGSRARSPFCAACGVHRATASINRAIASPGLYVRADIDQRHQPEYARGRRSSERREASYRNCFCGIRHDINEESPSRTRPLFHAARASIHGQRRAFYCLSRIRKSEPSSLGSRNRDASGAHGNEDHVGPYLYAQPLLARLDDGRNDSIDGRGTSEAFHYASSDLIATMRNRRPKKSGTIRPESLSLEADCIGRQCGFLWGSCELCRSILYTLSGLVLTDPLDHGCSEEQDSQNASDRIAASTSG